MMFCLKVLNYYRSYKKRMIRYDLTLEFTRDARENPVSHQIDAIPESPYLQRARAFGFHVREHIEAYVEDEMQPSPWLHSHWTRQADEFFSDTVHLMRFVYGIHPDDLCDQMLADLLDEVFMQGATWEEFVEFIRPALDGK